VKSIERVFIAVATLISASATAQETRTAGSDEATIAAETPVSSDEIAKFSDAPAPAAESSQPRNRLVEEIVVTAQRKSEAINDVPIAISAFTGDTLDALGVTDTRDLGKIVPGFTAADSGGNTPVYTLRGIGFNDQTYTATSTVGVYVDEVSLPYSIMTKGANLDLKRVEVLKGPQGTLYGRNTTGGAINYIANKPTDSFESGVTAGYARFGASQLQGFVSGPLTETLNGRLAVSDQRSTEGWQYSNTRPDDTLGRIDKQALRGLLDWLPNDDMSFEFSVSAWRDGSDPQAPQAIYLQPQNQQVGSLALASEVSNYPLVNPGTDDTRVADWDANTDWRLRDTYWQASGRADWNLEEVAKLSVIYSHGAVESDGSMIPQSGFDFYNGEQQLFARVVTDSVEARIAGVFNDNLTWLAGINAARDDGRELHKLFLDTVSTLYPNPANLPPSVISTLDTLFPNRPIGRSLLADRVNSYGKTKAETYGIFMSSDWSFADDWQLTLGARYSDESRTFEGCTFEDPSSRGLGLAPLFAAIAAQRGSVLLVQRGDCITLDAQGRNELFHGKLDESNISYRSALNWKPDEGLLLYVSYTRGYKSGGFPVVNASDQSQYVPVKQERLLATEIGGKLDLFDRMAHLNFALFDYDYKDKQLLTRRNDPVFGPLAVLRNAPESKVQGAELELQVSPSAGLFLSSAASYIDTKVKSFVGTGFDGKDIDFSGKPFNFAPLVQYTVLADYEFPVADERLFLGLSGDYSFTGKTNSTLEGNPNYAHREFGLVGARVRLSDAERIWNLILWGRNITNEFSQVSIFNIGDAVARYAGMPRTFGVTLSHRFE